MIEISLAWPLAVGGLILIAFIGMLIGAWLNSGDDCDYEQALPWYVQERRQLENRYAELTGGVWLGPGSHFPRQRTPIQRLEKIVKSCKEAGIPVPAQVTKDLRTARTELKEASQRIAKLEALERLVDAGYVSVGTKFGIEPENRS